MTVLEYEFDPDADYVTVCDLCPRRLTLADLEHELAIQAVYTQDELTFSAVIESSMILTLCPHCRVRTTVCDGGEA